MAFGFLSNLLDFMRSLIERSISNNKINARCFVNFSCQSSVIEKSFLSTYPISTVLILRKPSKCLGVSANVNATTFPFSSPTAAGYAGLP